MKGYHGSSLSFLKKQTQTKVKQQTNQKTPNTKKPKLQNALILIFSIQFIWRKKKYNKKYFTKQLLIDNICQMQLECFCPNGIALQD